MGLFKILVGAAAVKTLRSSNRPGVIPPPGYTVTGMKHKGVIGSKWKISYIKNDQPNLKKNFTINKGTRGRTSGSDRWEFHWN